jgi:hypothetical protein
MTYRQWFDKYVKNSPAEMLHFKKTANQHSDKRLFEKYKAELGRNAISTLDELQNMKYTEPDRWARFETYAGAVRRGELTPLADFDLYEMYWREANERLVGLTTSNGVSVKSVSLHFPVRVIGSTEQKRNGVTFDDVFKALTGENSRVGPIVSGEKGNSQRFTGLRAKVALNPDTGNLIQTNETKGAK